MAKAKAKKAVKKSRSVDLHKELERPVNNLVGYSILFLVALVLFFLVKEKIMF